MDGANVHEEVMEMYPQIVAEIVNSTINGDKSPDEWNLEELNNALEKKLLPKGTNLVTYEFVEDCDAQDLIDKLLAEVDRRYDEKVKIFKEHIDQMNQLRNEIGLQSYGQHDPIVAYKQIGFEMFEQLIDEIKEKTALFLLNVKIEAQPTMRQVAKPIMVVEQKTARADTKISRNAPCPCGSGKKYKQCCGKN